MPFYRIANVFMNIFKIGIELNNIIMLTSTFKNTANISHIISSHKTLQVYSANSHNGNFNVIFYNILYVLTTNHLIIIKNHSLIITCIFLKGNMKVLTLKSSWVTSLKKNNQKANSANSCNVATANRYITTVSCIRYSCLLKLTDKLKLY